MRYGNLTIRMLVSLLFCFSSATLAAADLHPWEVFEIELSAERQLSQPYTESLPEGSPGYVTAVFHGKSGTAERPAAYRSRASGTASRSGGSASRRRRPGEWTYRSRSARSGPGRQDGPIRVRRMDGCRKGGQPDAARVHSRRRASGPRPGRYFEYADGTPMLWLGDTWWNWTKRGIPLETLPEAGGRSGGEGVQRRASCFCRQRLGRESSLLDRTCTRPDLEQIRRVEEMIRYANSQGDHGLGSRLVEPGGDEGADRRGEHPPLVALHGPSPGCLQRDLGPGRRVQHAQLRRAWGCDFWKDLGRLIDEEDPYERIIGVHPTPPGWEGGAEAPQWSTAEVIHGEPWLDYNQSQTGHGRWRNELIP